MADALPGDGTTLVVPAAGIPGDLLWRGDGRDPERHGVLVRAGRILKGHHPKDS